MNNLFSLSKQSRQLLDLFCTISTEFLCITDERGTILQTNQVWETKLGYLNPDLCDKNLIDLVHPNDVPNLILGLKKLTGEKESLTLTTRLHSNFDSYLFVTWQFKWVDELIFCCGKDLTELYQAKKDADSANFSKNQLMSILSNELKEPLESQFLFFQLMSKTNSWSDQKTCLENIHLSASLLRNLIDGLLATDNKQGHDVIAFDFHTTVEDAIIPLISSAKRHNITIELSIHSKTPAAVVGDPQRLKQIISYLILNAIKCLEQGKISLEVTPENTDKSVFKIYFVIKTSGISPLQNDFADPFLFTEASNITIANNLSFGLELVKTLVETMNGKFSAAWDNENNYEFSFHVLLLRDDSQALKNGRSASQHILPMYNKNLRLKDDELTALEQIVNDQTLLSSSGVLQQRPKLLVVDDSTENTQLLAEALVEKYDVTVANSGKAALTMATQKPLPDLILLDLSMPEMNGFEVSKQIQLEESTMSIPIIFLTTLSDKENKAYGAQTGAVDFISKPFDLSSVEQKIKYQLALKHYREILSNTADIDALTQISNRRRFQETLAIEIRKARRNKTPLSLIRIDIDCFKLYNQTYGHAEGDACLQEVAGTIEKTLKRAGDLAARWEGEEFICLLPDTNLKGAAHVAEIIRKTVVNMKIPHQTSPIAKFITLSLGVATGVHLDKSASDSSLTTLLARSETALTRAKKAGRNQIFIFRND
ncbi:diguanylate cyclase domain-containing protein [Acetobacterium wieringae]|uniref:diguanylate cyclase domain-containing protein n=1 Tax=Acetobacterium wieringae TaxID=52694 RepID=UPI0026F11A6D|nr:diguanylate cyclase [Acetobacterium wieringae]